MNNPLKRISLILGSIVIIPVLIFFATELATLDSDEELIGQIYQNQLESIVYSVNQYSEDYITSWTTNLNTILFEAGNDTRKLTTSLTAFIRENISISHIFFSDSLLKENITYQFTGGSFSAFRNDARVKTVLNGNNQNISKLFSYEKSGYRKIEPLKSQVPGINSVMVFLIGPEFQNFSLCGIVLDPSAFVGNILAPKMQQISREDIIITCYNINSDEIIYSNFPVEKKEIQHEGALWLLPEYKVAISLKGRTIEGLVKQRSLTNLILIGLITLVLLAGVFFVYRNVKREVRLAQIKSDFVSNVSHELRTPLALISMFAETLEMNRVATEEKKQEYYKIISQETNRLSRIVNKILNFSKMEAGKRVYKLEHNDLNEILKSLLNTYNFHLSNKGFSLKLDLSENELKINGDKEAISEAIINIIDNAIKYSDKKKEIEIKTGQKKEYAFISVRDSGVGISDEDNHKIFEKFFRVSSGFVHNTKGTGMGLSIVQHIVESHGGKIELKSKPGEGSEFKLHIPLIATETRKS